jgi:glutaconate CoA-transferase subunit B
MSSPMPADTQACSREAFLIAALTRLIGDAHNVAVGASSPIPAAAALLAQALSDGRTQPMLLGSNVYGPFNDNGPELFDRAGQGRIDVFFLGGGQIDGAGNINLVATGDYPKVDIRFPGSFGSAYLYYMVPRTILFRAEHSTRVLVPKVDFISAPGTSDPVLYRKGGPYALLTSRAQFRFDAERGLFRLESLHPGEDADAVRADTGFEYDEANDVPVTPAPPADWLALINGVVRERLAEVYPAFAESKLG